MSGSFENLDVPPTLVSFAVTTDKAGNIVSNEFKQAGHIAVLLSPEYDENSLPKAESLKQLFSRVTELLRNSKAVACYTPERGGIAAAVMKMAFGNGFGFDFNDALPLETLFEDRAGRFILEVPEPIESAVLLGRVNDQDRFSFGNEAVAASQLLSLYEGKLENVFPCNIHTLPRKAQTYSFRADAKESSRIHAAQPRVLIPVFPGTNCEYDSAKAVRDAGAVPEVLVLNNLTAAGITDSVNRFASALKNAQIVFIPGGFSGGDEPDGSGKFITAFFRSAAIRDGVTELLDQRDGMMLGICNGFQALIKLGLVPYGKIIDADESCPTLTYNVIGRHQSRIVRTRVASNKSPWLRRMEVGDVVSVPISHGEGRFVASEQLIARLAANGQIATQYVDENDEATYDVHFNPNGSECAIEGITSPDGRVLGKMGHSERAGKWLYKNVPGNYDIGLFRAAADYYR